MHARATHAVALAALAGLLAAVPATGAAHSGKPAYPTTLTIGIPTPPALDPTHYGTGPVQLVRLLAYAPLMLQTPAGPVVGGLALSYHYVDTSNRHFEMVLRRDARFSDGARVDAVVVRDWLRHVLASDRTLARTVGHVTSITTHGRWTIELNLAAANPTLPRALSQAYDAGLVAGPKALAGRSSLAVRTDGAGPYVLDPNQTTIGRQYVFVPNRYYYGRSGIRFKRVVVDVIRDAGVMLRKIDAGQLSIATGNLTTATQATYAHLGVLHYVARWNGLVFLPPSVPNARDPLADVRVRKAINLAVDRVALSELAIGPDVGRYGAPGSTQAAGQLWGVPTSEIATTDGYVAQNERYYPYDPARARRLLAAAGYPKGFVLHLRVLPAFNEPLIRQALVTELARVGISAQTTTAPRGAPLLAEVEQNLEPTWSFYQDELPADGAGVHDTAMMSRLTAIWRRARGLFPPDAIGAWRALSAELTSGAFAVPLYNVDGLYYVSAQVGGVDASELTGGPDPARWYPTGVPQPTYH